MRVFGSKPNGNSESALRGSFASSRAPVSNQATLASAAIHPAISLPSNSASDQRETHDAVRRRAPGLFASLLPISTHDRVLFLRQMALMLRTGMSLTEALEVCHEQAANGSLRSSIKRMCEAIRRGASFSRAMLAEKRCFSTFIIRLIATAEASGEMDTALDNIASFMEKRAQLQNKLITSMIYPAIIAMVAVGVVTFLVLKVIPKFADFLSRRQTKLPWSTQMLLDVSAFASAYTLAIVASLFIAAVAFALFYKSSRGRWFCDRVLIRIPILGGICAMTNLTLLCSTLSMLLRSGVTLLESLPISSGVLGNRAISHHVDRASDQLLAGRSLSASFRDRVFPTLFLQVVSVGERTGTMSQVLDELGEYYESRLQSRLQRMVALVEPAMLIVIGSVVGFVYHSLFQAILQLSARG